VILLYTGGARLNNQPVYRGRLKNQPVYSGLLNNQPVYSDRLTNQPVYRGRLNNQPVYSNRFVERATPLHYRSNAVFAGATVNKNRTCKKGKIVNYKR